MRYEICLPIKDFEYIFDLMKSNGYEYLLRPREIFVSNLNLMVSFKTDKEGMEKIMFFLPDSELKTKLQGKIDFWILAGEW